MTTLNFTSKEYGRRFRKALSAPFIFEQACSPSMQEFVKSYADSIGCNEKCILFPLLSCCAACIGPKSYLEITPKWHERLVIWTLVLTPMTLQRIDIAEHFKQILMDVQDELFTEKEAENDSIVHGTKFLVSNISMDTMDEILKDNDGHVLGVYNSTRHFHGTVSTTQHVEQMRSLHSGFSWFSNCEGGKKSIRNTHANFSILSCPSVVHNSLTNFPNFQELYHDCFLTICAEENHVKLAHLAASSECESLHRIFKDIITLHLDKNVVYKLSKEGFAKFTQIHDEISEKARQLARKNSAKVFFPALVYLARVSCVLHVMDNVLEAIKFAVPVDPTAWNSEISADTVWRARQVLGYVIEQKFILSQPTMVDSSPSVPKRVESVTVVDGPVVNNVRGASVRSNLFASPQRQYNSPHRNTHVAPRNSYISPQRMHPYSGVSPRGRSVHLPQRNIHPTPASTDRAFDLLLASTNTNNNVSSNSLSSESTRTEPMISEVRSAGVPVPVSDAITPVIESVSSLTNNGIQSSVSMSLIRSSSASSKNTHSSTVGAVTPQSVAIMSEEEFLRSFKVQTRRLLMYGASEISLSLCVQLEFMPKPLGGFQSLEQKTAMARIFLKRLETLGFGVVDGSNGTSSRRCMFRKNRYNTLNDKQCQILTDLRVSEREYDKSFSQENNSNQNGVVCLE